MAAGEGLMTKAALKCALVFSRMGEAAILCDAGGPLSLPIQKRIWQLSRIAADWPFARQVVCAVNNLMVIYDPHEIDHDSLEKQLAEAWEGATGATLEDKLVEVPVRFGGADGVDLRDVAARRRLDVEEVVACFSDVEYTVLAIGSDPGFSYLYGLDPCLHLPRRDVPRLNAPGGSVMIGGSQAGIQPVAAPCGWHLIGRTGMTLFDASRPDPALLSPGNRVRFIVENVVR
jgi:KipI family sensor histidine kinase inhibitor